MVKDGLRRYTEKVRGDTLRRLKSKRIHGEGWRGYTAGEGWREYTENV